MRSIFAFGLLIALCCSAEAATVHHAHTRHHRLTAFANSFAKAALEMAVAKPPSGKVVGVRPPLAFAVWLLP